MIREQLVQMLKVYLGIDVDNEDERTKDSIDTMLKAINSSMEVKLEHIKRIAWGEDIPSPTCQEYIEHHESIQRIMKSIDAVLQEVR